ncbi:MAG TPA: hypothetical protein VFW59_08640 [Gallionella sp.]|nr:hypothetical protein [Gallionella sp.]
MNAIGSKVDGSLWKEEVQLHDGSRIIVRRAQRYGELGEFDLSLHVQEHTISFELPRTGKTLTFKSQYGADIERTNFNLLALHILDDTPFLIAEANLYRPYNKWRKPALDYVVFKHDGKDWLHIPLMALPAGIKTVNLIVNGCAEDIERAARQHGYVPAEEVRKLNRRLAKPKYHVILRETE